MHNIAKADEPREHIAPTKERKVNKQIPDFNEVFGQLLPVAEQMQQQMQAQFQQAMGAFGQLGPLPGLQAAAPLQNATMGAIQPFMNSIMGACQAALTQIPVHSLGQIQAEYAAELSALMASAFSSLPNSDSKTKQPVPLDSWIQGDKRFASADWHDHGVYEFTAAMYSLNARFTKRIVELVPDSSPEKRKVEY
ncbi:MAG TPA: class I poly(R)-hydroxyalkanoic acid synthase, partial [Limnobacter sp.]|nr:class I poly(R)-hydroxyalkanoic acid synthase [Limnobacter sp.]